MALTDFPQKKNEIPVIGSADADLDTAARIAYGRFKYALPKIICGKKIFVWPAGTEAFRRSGNSTLGIHKYIGKNYVDVHEIHQDEAHIEMSGTFAGLTSQQNMIDLIDLLISVGPKSLYVPGVFATIQTVFCENYDFNHAADDRTHSIDYTISFVRTVTGAKITARMQAAQQQSSPATIQNTTIAASPDRTATVSDSMKTLREVSAVVYGDADKWRTLVTLNQDIMGNYNTNVGNLTAFQLATQRLPNGTAVRY